MFLCLARIWNCVDHRSNDVAGTSYDPFSSLDSTLSLSLDCTAHDTLMIMMFYLLARYSTILRFFSDGLATFYPQHIFYARSTFSFRHLMWISYFYWSLFIHPYMYPDFLSYTLLFNVGLQALYVYYLILSSVFPDDREIKTVTNVPKTEYIWRSLNVALSDLDLLG